MADNIVLKTFAGQLIEPKHDALIYQVAIRADGMIYGGGVTQVNSTTLHVAGGFGLVQGREFEMYDTDLTIPLQSAGTTQGCVMVRIDLSNTEEPITLEVIIGRTTPRKDDNFNIVDGVWEMVLATFSVSTTSVSNLQEAFTFLPGYADLLVSKTNNAFYHVNSSGAILQFFKNGGGTESVELAEMTGAGSSQAGVAGLVPAPAAGSQTKYLKGDGTWANLPVMVGAALGLDGEAGIVPMPPSGDAWRFLSASGEWLRIGSMRGATAEYAGDEGIVPTPAAGSQGKFLRGDATWSTPPNATQSAAGYLSAADKKKLDNLCLIKSVNIEVTPNPTISAKSAKRILTDWDPRTHSPTTSTTTYLASTDTLIGASFEYASESKLYCSNVSVGASKLTLDLFNPTDADITITTLRMMLFYR